MSLTIADRTINRVLIVDDDKNLRENYGYQIEELGLEPIYEDGPLGSLDDALKLLRSKADALVCDLHLRIKNFSQINGDLFVASSNRANYPAVLCTNYTDSDITVMRSKRRYIPALLKTETYHPENIKRGFERCIRESTGIFDASRRPWRTLVRIADIEENRKYFYAVVPGWNTQQKIRVYFDDLPTLLRDQVQLTARFHAQVNLGAEGAEELYFSDWEGK